MKLFTVFMFVALTVSGTVFAQEGTTECPMMRESTERNNPKANLGTVKPRTTAAKGKGVKQ